MEVTHFDFFGSVVESTVATYICRTTGSQDFGLEFMQPWSNNIAVDKAFGAVCSAIVVPAVTRRKFLRGFAVASNKTMPHSILSMTLVARPLQ